MAITHKKKDNGLFFDSFKHFKHNLSNLIAIELPTLYKLNTKRYISLISTNYKSKYPDMRKIGLIDYKTPQDNKFSLTQEGEFFIKNAKIKQNFYDKNALKLGRKNIDSIKPQSLIACFNKKELESYRYEMLKLILHYYYSADSLRPYLALLNFIREHKFQVLDSSLLQNILAHKKEDILLFNYDENAFEKLDFQAQDELKRPISYIYNFLQSALVLDSTYNVIVDYAIVDRIKSEMEHIIAYQPSAKQDNSRPAKAQREFRNSVLKAYGYKCAITNKAIFINERCLLEAAHIIPYKDGGSFSVNNGIALSYEMHKMFDNGLFSFMYNEKGVKIQISKSKQIKDEQGILNDLQDKQIYLPQNEKYHPDKMALEYSLKKILV